MNKSIKLLAVFLLLLIIWVCLAPLLAILLIVEKPLEKADAIWILSGSYTYRERNQTAAVAYKKGIANRIILTDDGERSGWSQIEERNIPYVELAKRELIKQGVPDEAIEILPGIVSGGTRFEAEAFAHQVRVEKLEKVLLVTSAYHSRRTLWTFNQSAIKNNLQVEIGMQIAPTGQQTPLPYFWWLSRKGWMNVGEEYVKMAYYWLFY